MSENIKHQVLRNWEAVLNSVITTAHHARLPQPKIVVVTKKQSIEVIDAVIEAGAKYLGENYPEEAAQKIAQVDNADIEWHMIGHIQSRKTEIVSTSFDLVHSVDRMKIANKLSDLMDQTNAKMPILLECNVSGEGSKSGFPAWNEAEWELLLPEIKAISELTGIELRGLMTMPPWDEDPETSRPYFIKLRNLLSFLDQQLGLKMTELSMGTSFDHLVAIQEGATFVRIGTAITGKRKY